MGFSDAAIGEKRSGGDQEMAIAHDLFFSGGRLKPDVETEADDIDVSRRTPGRAGVLSVRIAEGDVDAGKFLVLKNVADDAGDADVGADGEFADAIGVLVGMGVGPEIPLELVVAAGTGDDAILCDLNRQRRVLEEAVASTEPVADNTIDNEDAIHFSG